MLARMPRYLMGLLYVIAGVNHFWHPGFYVGIMPAWFPAPLFWVQVSGVAEVLLGVGVCVEQTRRAAAWLIVAMLAVFLIVHVDMIVHAERFPDLSPIALWVRVVLQAPLMYWAWRYTRGPRP